MSGSLLESAYGKSRVRLTKVTRLPDRHELTEMAVDIALQGAFERSYTDGDNSQVVATDTMKNTVYALAAKHQFSDCESFGKLLGEHFLSKNAHIDLVSVNIAQDKWDRVISKGKPHQYAFVGGNAEKRVAHVDSMRGITTVEAGIENLMVLKTTGSEFWGFLRDEFTTLPEVHDRIFATSIMAHWVYKHADVAFNANFDKLRQLFLDVFADHHSLAVQQTLYAMCEAALDACSDIEEIQIAMPNQHRLPVDLTRFGMENRNEIFVPTDEPHGLISARVGRNVAEHIKDAAEPVASAKSNKG